MLIPVCITYVYLRINSCDFLVDLNLAFFESAPITFVSSPIAAELCLYSHEGKFAMNYPMLFSFLYIIND